MKKRYALEYDNTKKILRWKPVFYTSMFFFYWFFQLSLNNSLLPYYIAKYSISSQGLFASLPLIGNLLLFVPAGIIVDRYDIAKIVKTSIMVIILSIIVVELTTLKNHLLLSQFFSSSFLLFLHLLSLTSSTINLLGLLRPLLLNCVAETDD